MRRLVLLTIFLAACTSGGPTSAEPGSPDATGAGAPQASGPEFAEIVKSGKLATYRVSYKMTTAGPDKDASAVTLVQTWYFKPPKVRLDLSGTGGPGSGGNISMFFLEDGTFFCTEDKAGKSCLQVSTDAAAAQNLGFEIQEDFRDDPAAFNATLRETRTIAGQQALCYLVRGTAGIGFSEGTFCYTRTGVPLLSMWAGGGASVTMEATSFTTNVPDSDFKLPVPPIRLP